MSDNTTYCDNLWIIGLSRWQAKHSTLHHILYVSASIQGRWPKQIKESAYIFLGKITQKRSAWAFTVCVTVRTQTESTDNNRTIVLSSLEHSHLHFSRALHQCLCKTYSACAAYKLWHTRSKGKQELIWMRLCRLKIKDLVMKRVYCQSLAQMSPRNHVMYREGRGSGVYCDTLPTHNSCLNLTM